MQMNRKEQARQGYPKKEQKKKALREITIEEAIQISMRRFARAIEYLKDK